MKNKIIFLLFIFLGFLGLIFSYQNLAKKIPYSENDEYGWISDSYFTQFLLQGNFSPKVWDNTTDRDQPTLTRFVFGLWLYPKYLEERSSFNNLDYTKFLIEHGFYDVDGLPEYQNYKDSIGPGYTTLLYSGEGTKEELVSKLGSNITKSIDLIQSVRILNSILLAFTVLSLFILFNGQRGLFFSLIFAFLYAYNSMILKWGLMAQSETLFLLFFNGSILFLYLYLFRERNIKNLILFSLFTGLCFSTKLNGIMPYFIFLIEIYIFRKKTTNKGILPRLIEVATPLLISLILFIALNPGTYPSPFQNVYRMFALRVFTVNDQSSHFPSIVIPGLIDRLKFVADTFTANSLFLSKKMGGNFFYEFVISILFLSGVLSEIRLIYKMNRFSMFIFIVFITTFAITILYLQLAWPRYLIHLVIFYTYFVTSGFIFYMKVIPKMLLRIKTLLYTD